MSQGLRGALKEFRLGRTIPPFREEFLPVETPRAVEALESVLAVRTPKPPSQIDREALLGRVKASWEASSSFESLRPRDRRRLPWVLFYPARDRGTWLGANPSVVAAWGGPPNPTPREVVTALREFLLNYPVDVRTFKTWLRLLRDGLTKSQRVSARRWRRACEDFGLLDRDGPDRCASELLSREEDPDALLNRAGFEGDLRGARFLYAVQERLEQRLQAGPTLEAEVSRVLQCLEVNGERLRFEERRVQVAEAILRPWHRQEPSQAVQERLRVFLLRHLKDLRMDPSGWSGVSDESRAVMLRWLVESTLEDFFRLLDHTALDRHWQNRKSFWRRYLDAGMIRSAWVTLGPEARRLARRHLSKEASGAYGRLSGPGIQQNHSVLVMKLNGGATVTEWSHMGKCRMWRSGNRTAPVVHQRKYSRDDLVIGADREVVHLGRWESKVASWLRAHAGLRV